MLNIIFGILIAVIYSILLLPSEEGNFPSINITIYPFMYNSMIIIPYNETNAIHIHHWLIFLFICLSKKIFKINDILFGFSLGLFIQGITYNDKFIFICNNPY